MKQLIDPN